MHWFRVLKNYEMNLKDKQSDTSKNSLIEMVNGTTKPPAEQFAEVLKNPQAALQKFVQSINNMA